MVEWGEELKIKAVVLDSPFQNFADIAQHIATSKLFIPSFIADMTLGSIKSAFSSILSRGVGEKYNPFYINFKQPITLSMPVVLLYSPDD